MLPTLCCARSQLEISMPCSVLFTIAERTMSFHFQKKEMDLYPLPAKHTAKCFGFAPLQAGNTGLFRCPFSGRWALPFFYVNSVVFYHELSEFQSEWDSNPCLRWTLRGQDTGSYYTCIAEPVKLVRQRSPSCPRREYFDSTKFKAICATHLRRWK